MKKIIFVLLLTMFLPIVSFAVQTTNYGDPVYAIFSENFNGIKVDLQMWTGQSDRAETVSLNDRDRAFVAPWAGGGDGINYSTLEYASVADSRDGNIYGRITTTAGNGWSGFTILFKDSASGDGNNVAPSMMEYSGGTLEFWARSSHAPSLNYQVGIQTNSGDKLVTLGNLGFVANNTWQKLSIDLTQWNSFLGAVGGPFHMITTNNPATFDFDAVVWRKPGNSVSYDVRLMDVATHQQSTMTYITWDNNSIGSQWKVANQYLELNLKSLPSGANSGMNWGIQIFSNATAANNPSASPAYSGSTVAVTFGLINTSDTARMLPMCWRVTDKALPYTGPGNANNQTTNIAFFAGDQTLGAGLYDSGSTTSAGLPDPNAERYHTWFFLKDKSQFGETGVYDGADYLRVWDRRGFHSAAGELNYFGMQPGGMINMRI
ncbi:MAG: hypothetical protein LBQ47_06050, partial [Endomicrobium sp.]|nr:hypothetical protein [Endomicrobium sp.]